MSNIMELNQDNFSDFINIKDTLCIVDFWAPWCGPCRMFSPVLKAASEKYADNSVLFGRVNVDENMQIALQYNVNVIPKLIIFKNGQIISFSQGVMDLNGLEKLIDELLNKQS